MDILTAVYITIVIGCFIFKFKRTQKKEIIQTIENMAKGTTTVGIQGSGKTCKALLDALDLLERGYYFTWITTQGERQSKICDLIPSKFKDKIELFAPYKQNSKGFNWLKCYTESENERYLKAQTTVLLFDNMFHISENMQSGILYATQAILEYAIITKRPMTLYDVWQFTKNIRFREFILSEINNKQLEEDFNKLKEDTIDAISRKFALLLNNKMTLNALCYTHDDGLDFIEMFSKVLICDFIEDNLKGLGTLQAIFLAQAIMIQFNILASTRRNDSPYYQIICDEFYIYAKGIKEIFRKFPDIHRQRNIGLYLIWQRMSQLDDDLVNIALSCVNKYFFTLQPEDDAKLSSKETYKPYKGQFGSLKEREYIAFINAGIGTTILKDRTKDLPTVNEFNYSYILNKCKSKYKNKKFEWWFNDYHDDHTVNLKTYEGNEY